MAELVDATDLKSVAEMLVGSSPTGVLFRGVLKNPSGSRDTYSHLLLQAFHVFLIATT